MGTPLNLDAYNAALTVEREKLALAIFEESKHPRGPGGKFKLLGRKPRTGDHVLYTGPPHADFKPGEAYKVDYVGTRTGGQPMLQRGEGSGATTVPREHVQVIAPEPKDTKTTLTKVGRGHYANADGTIAVTVDGYSPGIIRGDTPADQSDYGVGGEWALTYDPNGRLREDHNAGDNLDWYPTKAEAQKNVDRAVRELEKKAQKPPATPDAPRSDEAIIAEMRPLSTAMNRLQRDTPEYRATSDKLEALRAQLSYNTPKPEPTDVYEVSLHPRPGAFGVSARTVRVKAHDGTDAKKRALDEFGEDYKTGNVRPAAPSEGVYKDQLPLPAQMEMDKLEQQISDYYEQHYGPLWGEHNEAAVRGLERQLAALYDKHKVASVDRSIG